MVYPDKTIKISTLGSIDREHFDALAPAICLGYMCMVYMALPYTIVLTIIGYLSQWSAFTASASLGAGNSGRIDQTSGLKRVLRV